MNLRKDHYQFNGVVAASGGSPRAVEVTLSRATCLNPFYTSTFRSPSVGQPAVGTYQNLFLHLALPVQIQTIVTTFNNGSLGSGIDEERSEMR